MPKHDVLDLTPDDQVASLVDDVRVRLAELADPVRAPAMQKYMKSALPYRGVSMPVCRRLWRTAFDVDLTPTQWWSAIELLWHEAEFREELYAAIGLARHRRFVDYQDPGLLEEYRQLIATGAWWDVVDEISTHLVRDLMLSAPQAIGPQLRAWSTSDDMWVRRASIIGQTGAGDQMDIELLSACIENNLDGSAGRGPAQSTYGKEFFIRKAIGWALRDYAYTDAPWVREYVERHRSQLSGLSIREATKHL